MIWFTPRKYTLDNVKRAEKELGPTAISNVKKLGSRNHVTYVSLLYGRSRALAQNIINIFYLPKN